MIAGRLGLAEGAGARGVFIDIVFIFIISIVLIVFILIISIVLIVFVLITRGP